MLEIIIITIITIKHGRHESGHFEKNNTAHPALENVDTRYMSQSSCLNLYIRKHTGYPETTDAT